MHRFFLPPDHPITNTVTLPEQHANQIARVLRMQPSDKIILLNNSGHEWLVQLEQVTKRTVTATVLEKRPNLAEPSVHLTLYLALLKKDNFELVLQKGTELGVSRFVPLVTRRTIIKEVKPNRWPRWQRILTEAAEQCGRGLIPELAEVHTVEEALAQKTADLTLIPYTKETTTPLTTHLATNPKTIALFVGPEGGWHPNEIDQAKAANAHPITLGPRILRAETAAILAPALILLNNVGAQKSPIG